MTQEQHRQGVNIKRKLTFVQEKSNHKWKELLDKCRRERENLCFPLRKSKERVHYNQEMEKTKCWDLPQLPTRNTRRSVSTVERRHATIAPRPLILQCFSPFYVANFLAHLWGKYSGPLKAFLFPSPSWLSSSQGPLRCLPSTSLIIIYWYQPYFSH